MTNEIKVGDEVICIDDTGLVGEKVKLNEKYKVTYVDAETIKVLVNNENQHFFSYRFKKVIDDVVVPPVKLNPDLKKEETKPVVSPEKFSVGDVVICIDNTDFDFMLNLNEKYKVTYISTDYGNIKVLINNKEYWFLPCRFKKDTTVEHATSPEGRSPSIGIFKAGDEAICIDNKGFSHMLNLNEKYKVTEVKGSLHSEIKDDYLTILIGEGKYYFYANRFKKAEVSALEATKEYQYLTNRIEQKKKIDNALLAGGKLYNDYYQAIYLASHRIIGKLCTQKILSAPIKTMYCGNAIINQCIKFGSCFVEIRKDYKNNTFWEWQILPYETMFRIETTKGKLIEFQQSKTGPDYQSLTKYNIETATPEQLAESYAMRFSPKQIVHIRVGEGMYGTSSIFFDEKGEAQIIRELNDKFDADIISGLIELKEKSFE